MSALTFDVTYSERRNRLTTACRIILAIPHLIVAQVWSYVIQIVAIVQWFIVLITGKRNEGIWKLQQAWLGYNARVMAYVSLLHDVFPPFGTEVGAVPVHTSIVNDEPANRLTNALRPIWAIPALVITSVLLVVAFVLEVISWFAIIVTGAQPRGMFGFITKALRYMLQTQSYILLMTDTYPKYG